jgi:pimeloyl-ACP methyl ester carboxylesterase
MIPIHAIHRTFALAAGVALASPSAHAQHQASAPGEPVLEMRPCELPREGGMARCGTYWALENREQPDGRRIPLDVVVIPARSATPKPDPVFFAYGGPGQTATLGAADWVGGEMNQERDIVLVDQRGTSPGHALDCRLSGTPENPQGYLEPMFSGGTFRTCRAELETRADLTRYLTTDYVEDLEEVRRALGYGQINIQGGSYGSRVVLFYLRQYPRSVRTAFMTGLYPTPLRSPLYHARDSQAVLDSIFALCARDAGCAGAFPHLRREFDETMDRLRREPARVTVAHPSTGAPLHLTMDANAFAEGVRVMMYNWDRSRRLPMLLHRAHRGDYGPFAAGALISNAGLRDMIRFGLNMSVVCSEDVSRIMDEEIEAQTRGTFFGDLRVRTQKAACAEWPRRELPAGYTDPVVSEVPALLISGAYDPSTAARWGAVAAQTLRNSLHIVIPAAHTAGSECVDRIRNVFLDRGTVQGLDTSCVAEMKRAPFVLTDEDDEGEDQRD